MARQIENGKAVSERIITSSTQFDRFPVARTLFAQDGESIIYSREKGTHLPQGAVLVHVTAPTKEVLYNFFRTARELNQPETV